jgi:hypothetical protein
LKASARLAVAGAVLRWSEGVKDFAFQTITQRIIDHGKLEGNMVVMRELFV